MQTIIKINLIQENNLIKISIVGEWYFESKDLGYIDSIDLKKRIGSNTLEAHFLIYEADFLEKKHVLKKLCPLLSANLEYLDNWCIFTLLLWVIILCYNFWSLFE